MIRPEKQLIKSWQHCFNSVLIEIYRKLLCVLYQFHHFCKYLYLFIRIASLTVMANQMPLGVLKLPVTTADGGRRQVPALVRIVKKFNNKSLNI